MENHRALIVLSIALAVGMPFGALAYSVTTHEGLMEVTLVQYERLRGEIFSAAESTAMVRGSNEEDDNFRYKYHFYDPINNRGLWGRVHSSKEWANNQELQGGSLSSWQGYFDRKDDYTWDRAIFEYVHGDRVRAAEALGHVIHLIQDTTVPAHVRDDAHGNVFGVGDPDTYEKYTGIFAKGNLNVVGRIVPRSFASLNEAFDTAARFTNENFYSDDTLLADYELPDKSKILVRGEYGYHPILGHRIALAKVVFDKRTNTYNVELKFEKSDADIPLDYWNILSRHAVESSIGVLDLFFQEVEEERRTGALKAKNLSPLKQQNKKLTAGFSIVKGLYGSSLTQGDVNELLNDSTGQAGAAALAVSQSQQAEAQPSPPAQPQPEVRPSQQSVEEQTQVQEVTEFEAPKAEEAHDQGEQQLKTEGSLYQQLVPVTPGFGGGGGVSSVASEEATEPEPEPLPMSLSIVSPLEGEFFATSSIVFSGTTNASHTVSLESGTATTSVVADSSGNWTAVLELLEGNPQVIVTASDPSDTQATSSTIGIFVDLTPPDVPTVSLPQCSYSLSSSFCLLATSSVAVSWLEIPNAAYYAVIADGSLGATTTATSSTAAIAFSASSTIAVVAYDEAGNAATSTSEAVYAVERPIIINEIGWGGAGDTTTTLDSSDQWIELKNLTIFDVDLSHLRIARDTGDDIALSGTLAASGIISILPHSHVVTGTKIIVPYALLSSAGEKMTLAWVVHGVEQALDSTPDVATCEGWCAGTASGVVGTSAQSGPRREWPRSMERIGGSVDGGQANSWQTTDSYGQLLGSVDARRWGTAGIENSNGYPDAGLLCKSHNDILVQEAFPGPGANVNGDCVVLSRFISIPTLIRTNRHGGLFRGQIASSTLVSTFSTAQIAHEHTFNVPTDATEGEQFFIGIWEIRTGPAFSDESLNFQNFMQTGAGSPPHSNYVVIPWTYAP